MRHSLKSTNRWCVKMHLSAQDSENKERAKITIDSCSLAAMFSTMYSKC